MSFDASTTTLRDYLKTVFKHKILFLVLPVAIMIPAFFALQLKTPTYSVSVKMLVKGQKPTEADYYRGIMSASITDDHAELVRSNIVLARVVDVLKLYETPPDYEKKFASPVKRYLIEQGMEDKMGGFYSLSSEEKKSIFFESAMNRLKGNISVVPVKTTSFFQIEVTDFDPRYIAKIANSLSRSYVIFDLEQQIQEVKLKYGEKHSTVKQLEGYIRELEKTLHGNLIPSIDAIGPASVKIIEQAQGARRDRVLNQPMLLSVVFFAGLFFSLVLAFMLEYFDQTLKSHRDIETFLKIPYLGSVPKKKFNEAQLINHATAPSKYSQALHDVTNQIYLLMNENNLNTILIADAENIEDTDAVIANIATCSADSTGHRILVIDADMKNSRVSNLLNLPNESGLSNVLKDETGFHDAVQIVSDNLHVLSSGSKVTHPTMLLNSSQMSEVIDQARKAYDLVFIKSSDINNNTDAVLLSSYVDGVILVINEGKVRRQVIVQALIPFQQKEANLVGVVLNNCKYVIPDFIYRIT